MIRALRRRLALCRWGLREHDMLGFAGPWTADMSDGWVPFPGPPKWSCTCMRCGAAQPG